MGFQSNITVKSNIYVNKTKSPTDQDFINHVRGYEALDRLNKIHGEMSTWRFSKAQKDEHQHGSPQCVRDKSGTKPWGLVIENGIPVFVCKCEKIDCGNSGTSNNDNKGVVQWKESGSYAECSNYSNFRKVERNNEAIPIVEEEYIPPDFGLLRYLDPDEQNIYWETTKRSETQYAMPEVIIKSSVIVGDQLEDCDETKFEINENNIPETSASNIERMQVPQIVTYKQIDSPDEIIEAEINDKIIVNAGPGTGKTYSLIKRLGYIVHEELADPRNILVLCYSRSAVAVIKKRIIDEILNGRMPAETTLLFNGIRTFDSFVTYMLSEGEIEGTINHLNYDERIERFIKEFENDSGALDDLEYLIVDEMQDLVGVRARMVKAILERIKCGFLLLGDRCQSIYDYQIKDEQELNSFRYYKWLNSHFNSDTKYFELIKNARQKEEIAMFTEYMRNAILSEEKNRLVEALDLCINTLKIENDLGNIRKMKRRNSNLSEAFLCRNNAEVSIISSELYSQDIKHIVSKKAQHIELAPWIAEILATYTENRIGISAFRERAFAAGYTDADLKWELLKSVSLDDNSKVLDIRLLVKTLVGGKDLPAELSLASSDLIIVSTIHRAKGHEHDRVVLISNDYISRDNSLEEDKVAYVALSRAKEEICFCSLTDEYNHNSGYFIKKYYKKVERLGLEKRGRFYAYMWHPRKKNKYPFCSNFEVGLTGDVSQYSFVHKEYNALKIQERIKRLKIGDPIQAKYERGHYYLYNPYDEIIGILSNDVTLDICMAMEEQNPGFRFYKNYQKPSTLTDIYVNNIVTVANTKFNEAVAEPYNKSGLWLGFEISGFGRVDRS